MDLGAVAFLGAFAAGILSFASPCVFPLIPAYLAQLTGMSFEELTGEQSEEQRRTLMINSIAFVIGLALVFVLLGASATFLGRFLVRNQTLVERLARFVIIVFGLRMMANDLDRVGRGRQGFLPRFSLLCPLNQRPIQRGDRAGPRLYVRINSIYKSAPGKPEKQTAVPGRCLASAVHSPLGTASPTHQ